MLRVPCCAAQGCVVERSVAHVSLVGGKKKKIDIYLGRVRRSCYRALSFSRIPFLNDHEGENDL